MILQQNEDKVGPAIYLKRVEYQSLRTLEFDDICAIGLFTTDSRFCTEFQRGLRSQFSGCKWEITNNRFLTALVSLHFAQNMGRDVIKTGFKQRKVKQ